MGYEFEIDGFVEVVDVFVDIVCVGGVDECCCDGGVMCGELNGEFGDVGVDGFVVVGGVVGGFEYEFWGGML